MTINCTHPSAQRSSDIRVRSLSERRGILKCKTNCQSLWCYLCGVISRQGVKQEIFPLADFKQEVESELKDSKQWFFCLRPLCFCSSCSLKLLHHPVLSDFSLCSGCFNLCTEQSSFMLIGKCAKIMKETNLVLHENISFFFCSVVSEFASRLQHAKACIRLCVVRE